MLKDRRGYSHLKEEALDRIMWRNRFGEGFEPVVRQNTDWMNEYVNEENSSFWLAESLYHSTRFTITLRRQSIRPV
jgi:hypothetical protein